MVHDLRPRIQPESFSSRVRRRAREMRTWLCVGIDPEPALLPSKFDRSPAGVVQFCNEIIEATSDLTTAYKLNFAFFEALGSDGWRALEAVRRTITSDVPVIADAKRGDIPNSAAAYAHAVFDSLDFDAVTVSPYLGWDSVEPFARYDEKCVFVLCKTSNAGAADVQDLLVEGSPLYLHVAQASLAMTTASDLGLVVGATQGSALQAVRALSEDVLLLVPGVGAQGANATTTVQLGGNRRGDNAIVPVSREILYASSGANFAEAARAATERRARQLWMDYESAHVDR